MNRWRIPAEMEQTIIERDCKCSYCGCEFSDSDKKSSPTWEHITNDARIVSYKNICRCCFSCNASKGAKDLKDWLKSNYCKRKGISISTVSEVVRNAFKHPPELDFKFFENDETDILDKVLQPNLSDEDLASETWVMLTGEELLILRKSIHELKAKLDEKSHSGVQ